jgi:hypothetical protein
VPTPPSSSIDALRQAILRDTALQRELAAESTLEPFLDRCADAAVRLSLSIGREAIAASLEPSAHSPVLLPPPAPLAAVPPRGWLPGELLVVAGQPVVEWLHFGDATLSEPFYAQSIARARALPINRLMRFGTPAVALAELPTGPDLDGFVFHMSRCGSTLVSQMLAALPRAISISEAPAIDGIARLTLAGRLPRETIRGLIGMLTGSGNATHRFVKFTSWQTILIPLLRELFPQTPWVFLYRDPVEVLVSQLRMPSPELLSGIAPSEAIEGMATARAMAMLIGRFAEAALAAFPAGGGIVVDYRDLPAAVETAILPHFGIAPDDEARQRMALAATLDVKRAGQHFMPDSALKQDEASIALREVAEEYINPAFRRLQTLG